MSNTLRISPFVEAILDAHKVRALSSITQFLFSSCRLLSLSLIMLIISSFEYGKKLTILGLHSGLSSKRGKSRSVKSSELAIPFFNKINKI
jgi:hypothetical protein